MKRRRKESCESHGWAAMWLAMSEVVVGGRKGEKVSVMRVLVRDGSAAWVEVRRFEMWLNFWLVGYQSALSVPFWFGSLGLFGERRGGVLEDAGKNEREGIAYTSVRAPNIPAAAILTAPPINSASPAIMTSLESVTPAKLAVTAKGTVMPSEVPRMAL